MNKSKGGLPAYHIPGISLTRGSYHGPVNDNPWIHGVWIHGRLTGVEKPVGLACRCNDEIMVAVIDGHKTIVACRNCQQSDETVQEFESMCVELDQLEEDWVFALIILDAELRKDTGPVSRLGSGRVKCRGDADGGHYEDRYRPLLRDVLGAYDQALLAFMDYAILTQD
jgi:hypothetical protein